MSNASTIQATATAIGPLDEEAMALARARQDNLTKPPGSLGRLEDVSVHLAGIFGEERPRITGKALIVAAGDHGVVAQGVTGYPQSVTIAMVRNFLAGGAAVSVMARQAGVRLLVVDAGVAGPPPRHPDLRVVHLGDGTSDISLGPAMSRAQAERAVAEGIAIANEQAQAGAGLIGVGEMGIGNSTVSSAVTAAMTGEPPWRVTGRGTGRTPAQVRAKAEVVRRVLIANRPDAADPIGVLAKVGGFELGVLAGLMLGAAAARRAVVLDGFITAASALIACRIAPRARDYLIASHLSSERGHRVALRHLRSRPLLDLGMRLGEGTGAVLAMGLVESAAACLRDMATFEEASVGHGEPRCSA